MTSSTYYQESLNFNTTSKSCVNSSQSLDMSSLIKPKWKTKTNKKNMMNDTTKEQNGKKSKTNNVVCVTLRLWGSWNLVNLTFNHA